VEFELASQVNAVSRFPKVHVIWCSLRVNAFFFVSFLLAPNLSIFFSPHHWPKQLQRVDAMHAAEFAIRRTKQPPRTNGSPSSSSSSHCRLWNTNLWLRYIEPSPQSA
jgi:hypothetical protein